MRFLFEIVDSSYLELLGSSELIRSQISELFVSTAGQKTVNQQHISSLLVSLPPLVEQHRIVAKADELLALCDKLQNSLASQRSTSRHLADAFVEQAVA
jgi:type I restriction enzyme S subunit